MNCAACGKEVKGGIGMGGVILCNYPCAEDVRQEMERLRAEGKSVRVSGIARQMYREMHAADGAYTLKDIPGDLWHRVKVRAAEEDSDIRKLILKALDEYLTKGR